MKWTTPYSNKHFPLPLPGTHHFFPYPRKNPLRCHIGKREDLRDKPWNWGGSSPLFAAIIVMMANFCGTCGENLGQIFKKNQYFLVTSSLHLLTCGKIPLHFQYTYPTHQAGPSQDSSSVPMNSCSPSLSSSPTGSTQRSTQRSGCASISSRGNALKQVGQVLFPLGG